MQHVRLFLTGIYRKMLEGDFEGAAAGYDLPAAMMNRRQTLILDRRETVIEIIRAGQTAIKALGTDRSVRELRWVEEATSGLFLARVFDTHFDAAGRRIGQNDMGFTLRQREDGLRIAVLMIDEHAAAAKVFEAAVLATMFDLSGNSVH